MARLLGDGVDLQSGVNTSEFPQLDIEIIRITILKQHC